MDRNSISQAVKAHEGSITCFGPKTSGDRIVSGGVDSFIHVLDINLNKIKSIDIKTLGYLLLIPRSVCEDKMENSLLARVVEKSLKFQETILKS